MIVGLCKGITKVIYCLLPTDVSTSLLFSCEVGKWILTTISRFYQQVEHFYLNAGEFLPSVKNIAAFENELVQCACYTHM